MLSPTIETERLVLRRYKESDIDAIYEIITDDRLTNYISYPPFTKEKELECIKLKTLDQDIALKTIKILQDNEYEPYIENGYEITDTVVNCIKISAEYCKDKEDAKRVVKILNDTLDVYAYASRIHINVNNPMNHKRQAVINLSNIINVPLDNFYVIGDSINDYEMIEAYNSAVVKNYNKELESLHPKVCDSVAEYIEELINN